LRLEHRIPPPVVMAVCALLMWLVAFPALDLALPFRALLAAAFFAAALIVGVAAVLGFHRAKTTLNPLAPEQASALVVRGVFRWTRNPMYLAMLLVLVAWACLVANAAALAILPLFVAYLNRFQIGPEERALQARFGGEFEQYKRTVRRWL
jgi:protein-S-isoprenylcysteine O-methyltransferase Ste14